MHYQKMYYLLFNAITDALHDIEAMNFGSARSALQQAQIKAESIYIDSADEKQGGD
ncbi:MAG: hypothetical protein IJG45_06100 [Oscillospiraceae bacterium]|nr:hypothetical protein [Oscillospiraceae bacterium]